MAFLKNLSFSIILICSLLESNAQNLQWARQLGSKNSNANNEECSVVQTDTLGNVYVIGYFFGTADFDPSPGQYLLSAATSSTGNAFFAKYNADGNLVWAHNLEVGIITGEVSKDGYFHVFGFTNKDMDFDPSTNSGMLFTASGTNFVAKYAPNGDFVWVKKITNRPSSSAIDLATNDVYAGQFGTITKLDATGNTVWENTFPTTSISGAYANSMTVDRNRNLILQGHFRTSQDFDFTAASFIMTTTGTNEDPFVASYSPNGALNWAIHIYGDVDEYAGNVETDDQGNIYITGLTNSTVMDFDPTPNVFTVSSDLARYSYLAKYTSTGSLIWAYNIPLYTSTALALDKKKNIFLTSSYIANYDLDPSPTVTAIPAMAGEMIVSFDGNTGFLRWYQLLSSSNAYSDMSYYGQTFPLNTLVTDNSNNLFSAGIFFHPGSSFTDFDPTPKVYPLVLDYVTNISDGFLAKYSPYQMLISTDKNTYCQGETAKITSTASGYFPSSNVLKIELSDANGDFSSSLTLATFTGSATGLATYTIPGNLTPSNTYKVRLSTSYPAYATSGEALFSVKAGLLSLSSISGAQTACLNDIGRQYSVSTLPGTTYLWTAPQNSTITGSVSASQVSINYQTFTSTGILKVRQQNAQGCYGDTQLSIFPLALPITAPIIGPTSICGNAQNINYVVNGPNSSTFQWFSTIPGIQPSGASTVASVNFNITSSGILFVQETDQFGCIGSPVSLALTPYSIPGLASISGLTSFCPNKKNVVYQISTVSGISYNWVVPSAASIVGLNTLKTVTVSFADFTTPGTIIAKQSNIKGCTVESSIALSPYPDAVISPILGPTSICGNATGVVYSVTSVNFSTPSWSISFPYVPVSTTANSITISVNNMSTTGMITVTQTNVPYGCVGKPYTLTVSSLPVPLGVPSIFGQASVCGNSQNVTYSVVGSNLGSSYVWTLPSRPTVAGFSTTNSINLSYNAQATNYQDVLSVKEINSYGCIGNNGSKQITVQSTPNKFAITGSYLVCSTTNSNYLYTNGNYNTRYQWVLPQNAIFDTPTSTSNWVYVKFKDYNGGIISFIQTDKASSCQSIQTVSITGIPDPVVLGPSSVCPKSQFFNTFTVSGLAIPNATYNWLMNATLLSTNQSGTQATFTNIQDSSFVVQINSPTCTKFIISKVSFEKSPNPPKLLGPNYLCSGVNSVTYTLSNTNKGYMYNWIAGNGFLSPTVLNDSSFSVNSSFLVNAQSSGKISVVEINQATGCRVTSLEKNVVGYPMTYLPYGKTTFCDTNQAYSYTLGYINPAYSYHWNVPSSIHVIKGLDSSSLVLKLKGNTNYASINVKTTNEVGCVTNSPNLGISRTTNNYLLTGTTFSCADSLISINLMCPNLLDNSVKQLDFCLTFNPALVSLPYNSPRFASRAYSYNPDITYEEISPGLLHISLKRNAYFINTANLLQLNFIPNTTLLGVGDSIVFQSCGISEIYNDNSVQNCFNANCSARYLPLNTTLNGKIYCSSLSRIIPLGYNASIPALYNPSYISGSTSTTCSALSAPILPDIAGNFSYDLMNGDYIHIERQILSTATVITYINSADAKKISDMINGYSMSPSNFPPVMEDLWAGDVNMDGKLTTVDVDMVLNRSYNGKFTQVDAKNRSWVFIDDYYSGIYGGAMGNYVLFDPYSRTIRINPLATIPVISDCQAIRKRSTGSCIDIQKSNYRGLVLGDLNTNESLLTGAGQFNNPPYSGFRTGSDSIGGAEIIADFTQSVQLGGSRIKFPLYVNAADTASSLDIYWNFDVNKLEIDSITVAPDNLNSNFKFAWNKIGGNALQISGFSPGSQSLYSNTEILWVTASLTGTGNPFTNTNLSLINGKKAIGTVRIASVTGEFESMYSFKPFLYPNPGDGTVKIGGLKNALSNSISIHVFNTLGVEVFHSDQVAESIYLGDVANGVYYVKIRVASDEYILPYTKL